MGDLSELKFLVMYSCMETFPLYLKYDKVIENTLPCHLVSTNSDVYKVSL